jgi:hypothetical protein
VPSEYYREVDCLQDIVDNIARIERHIAGVDKDALPADKALERLAEPQQPQPPQSN